MTIVRDEFRSAVKRIGGEYGRWLSFAASLSYRLRQEVQERMWRAYCRRCDLAFDGYRDTPLVGDSVVTRRHEVDDDDEEGRVTPSGTSGKIVEISCTPGAVGPHEWRIRAEFPNGAHCSYSLYELCDPDICDWTPPSPEPWYLKELNDRRADLPEIAPMAKESADFWERMRRRGAVKSAEWSQYIEGLRDGMRSRISADEARQKLEQWLCALRNCGWIGMVEDTTAEDPSTAPLVAEWAFTPQTCVYDLAKTLPADTRVRMADGSVK